MSKQESKYKELLGSLKDFYEECGEELLACYEEAHDILTEILSKHGIMV